METDQIASFPYEDVLPFLKEHVQPSDQMLVMGCGTELPLLLSRDGYGTRYGRGSVPLIWMLQYHECFVHTAGDLSVGALRRTE